MLSLSTPLKVDGNIEDWLRGLELHMQRAVRRECRYAAHEIGSLYSQMTLREFCDRYIAQVWIVYLPHFVCRILLRQRHVKRHSFNECVHISIIGCPSRHSDGLDSRHSRGLTPDVKRAGQDNYVTDQQKVWNHDGGPCPVLPV